MFPQKPNKRFYPWNQKKSQEKYFLGGKFIVLYLWNMFCTQNWIIWHWIAFQIIWQDIQQKIQRYINFVLIMSDSLLWKPLELSNNKSISWCNIISMMKLWKLSGLFFIKYCLINCQVIQRYKSHEVNLLGYIYIYYQKIYMCV